MIKTFVQEKLKKIRLKENMTGYLVRKKKRGTYQALEECDRIEEEMKQELIDYLEAWLRNELFFGKYKKDIERELEDYLKLELNKKGFPLDIDMQVQEKTRKK